ncbi:LTA synthase family protein [Brevibacillus centrosporus]|uniref:LTA synthase family protein n=1 Tax=Brevibacillus centrosporus TaxID=54910 RepID=UPI00398867A7
MNGKRSAFVLFFVLAWMKCVLFYGFLLDESHDTSRFFLSFVMILWRFPFYIGFLGLFLCLLFLFRGRAKAWIGWGLLAILSAIVVSDLWYFRGFETLPSLHVLQQSGNLQDLGGSIRSMARPWDLLLIFDVMIIPIHLWMRPTWFQEEVRSWRAFSCWLIVCLLCTSAIPALKAYTPLRDSWALYSTIDSEGTAYNLSPIGYHILDAIETAKEGETLALDASEKEKIKDWYAQKETNLEEASREPFGQFRGYNLLLLQVESLEAFVWGQSVEGQAITPTLNEMKQHSYWFSRFYEQVGEGTTSDAEFTANTGVYPLRKSSVFVRFPMHRYPSLPKWFEESGYSSISMHPDKGAYWNWKTAHQSLGYDTRIDSLDIGESERIGMGISDQAFLQEVSQTLAKQPQPFVSFAVTLSSHAPFDLDEKYRSMRLPAQLDQHRMGGYFQSIHYVDAQIGKLLASLRENNLLDRTVVVVYGDHEGIHKYYDDEVATTPLAGNWWKENHKRVPFLIYHPSLSEKEISIHGGQVDILPTLAHLFGLPASPLSQATLGRNLFTTADDFAVLRKGDVVGNLPNERATWAKQGPLYADRLIRSNMLLP